MLLRSGAMGALLTVMATAASAVPVTFDFMGGSGETPSASFAEGGLGLTVTSAVFDDSGALLPMNDDVVTLNAGGLGGRHALDTVHPENNVFADGRSARGFNDLLVFAFDQAVSSIEVAFTERAGFEASRFTLFTPMAGALATDGQQFDVDADGALAFGGALFGIGALGDDDQFLISSITLDVAPSVIPVPATGALLLGGLGLLGLRRRG